MSGSEPIDENDLIAFRSGTLSSLQMSRLGARIASEPEAQDTLREWDRQDQAIAALYGPVIDEPMPEAFRRLLQSAEGQRPERSRFLSALGQVAAAVALLAVGTAGGWIAARMDAPAPVVERLADSALRAYQTYAVEVAHPVEVDASDAVHLTNWLSKRLGHPIAPPDFASAGFRLVGGRLLSSETGPAALFMYENDLGRRVTLFAAPGAGARETAFQFSEAGGAQSFYWVDRDLCYAVVGDVPREALRAIALAAYDQLT